MACRDACKSTMSRGVAASDDELSSQSSCSSSSPVQLFMQRFNSLSVYSGTHALLELPSSSSLAVLDSLLSPPSLPLLSLSSAAGARPVHSFEICGWPKSPVNGL